MSPTVVYSVGFIAQLFFTARMLLQWLTSEAAGRVVSPAAFWWLSLAGSFAMMAYGMLRSDAVIIIGQFPLYYIYFRNLVLQGVCFRNFFKMGFLIVLLPFLFAVGFGIAFADPSKPILSNDEISMPLLILGGVGTTLFFSRFLFQWIVSERSNRSILPLGFWLISLGGGVMLLTYGFLRHDPVLVIGQLFGSIVYLRNIFFLKRSPSYCS